jgi:hypothetical protein
LLGNPRSASLGTFTVGIGILNADHDRVSYTQLSIGFVRAQFPDDYRSIADVQLYAMIANAQAHAEPKCIAQQAAA